MSNTGYKISTGADLITVFNPYTTGTKATATGFKIAGGSDLNTVFAPLNGGSQATATGFKIAGGSDLNTVFAKYLNFPFTIPNTLSYNTSIINGYNVLTVTSGTGTIAYNSNSDISVEAIGGGGDNGNNTTFAAGSYGSGPFYYANGGEGGGGGFVNAKCNTTYGPAGQNPLSSILITNIGSRGNRGNGGNTVIRIYDKSFGDYYRDITAYGGTVGSDAYNDAHNRVIGGNGGNGGNGSSSSNGGDAIQATITTGKAGIGGRSDDNFNGSNGTGSSSTPTIPILNIVVNYGLPQNPGAVIIFGW